MLIVDGIYYSIQGKTILNGVGFTLDREKKVIVGENGSGKTTLLEIIVGNKEQDKGSVFVKGKIAYVPQGIKATNRTGLEIIEDGIKQIKDIERKIEVAHNITAPDEISNIVEEFEKLGGYSYKSEITKLLSAFDLDEETVKKSISNMSGGERTKCLLISAILSKPDILILDEPTNNLSIESIEKLETFLKNFKGGVLIVSHDKVLINKLANSILYLENGKLKEYPGNYDNFMKIKTVEDETKRKELEKLKLYIEKERKFIEKFRYGTRSSQAIAREKQIEKLKLPETVHKKTISINIESGDVGSEKVCELRNVSKEFNGKIILRDINLKITRGDRIALIGKNGSGKTTLLQIITGFTQPTSGFVYLGPSIQVNYFPQDGFLLKSENTLLDEIVSQGLQVSEARSYLAEFGFVQDEVFKTVESLSGGEKRRLIIAKMGLTKGNFLILDEPTNHLDIETTEALIDTLKNYTGTILLVSHDRFLINSIAKKVYKLKNGVLIDPSEEKPKNQSRTLDKEKLKEINKIKARILYLEKLLSTTPNKKKETELKILKNKLRQMS